MQREIKLPKGVFSPDDVREMREQLKRETTPADSLHDREERAESIIRRHDEDRQDAR